MLFDFLEVASNSKLVSIFLCYTQTCISASSSPPSCFQISNPQYKLMQEELTLAHKRENRQKNTEQLKIIFRHLKHVCLLQKKNKKAEWRKSVCESVALHVSQDLSVWSVCRLSTRPQTIYRIKMVATHFNILARACIYCRDFEFKKVPTHWVSFNSEHVQTVWRQLNIMDTLKKVMDKQLK